MLGALSSLSRRRALLLLRRQQQQQQLQQWQQRRPFSKPGKKIKPAEGDAGPVPASKATTSKGASNAAGASTSATATATATATTKTSATAAAAAVKPTPPPASAPTGGMPKASPVGKGAVTATVAKQSAARTVIASGALSMGALLLAGGVLVARDDEMRQTLEESAPFALRLLSPISWAVKKILMMPERQMPTVPPVAAPLPTSSEEVQGVGDAAKPAGDQEGAKQETEAVAAGAVDAADAATTEDAASAAVSTDETQSVQNAGSVAEPETVSADTPAVANEDTTDDDGVEQTVSESDQQEQQQQQGEGGEAQQQQQQQQREEEQQQQNGDAEQEVGEGEAAGDAATEARAHDPAVEAAVEELSNMELTRAAAVAAQMARAEAEAEIAAANAAAAEARSEAEAAKQRIHELGLQYSEKYETLLSDKMAEVRRLKTEVLALDNALEQTSQRDRASYDLHRISAAALALERVLETAEPCVEAIQALKAVVGGDKLFVALLEALPTMALGPGVPTLQDLQMRFPLVREEARKQAHVPDAMPGIVGQAVGSIFSKITFQPEGLVQGDGVDERLSRAKFYVDKGELPAAIDQLRRVEGVPGEILHDWLDAAAARVVVDQTLTALRAHSSLLHGRRI